MNRIDSINIGDILKIARENNGYTQEEIAKLLNVGRDAIIRIEKGTRKVTADEIHKLIKLYNLNIEDIFYNDLNIKTELLKELVSNFFLYMINQ